MSEVKKILRCFKAYIGAPNSKGTARFDPKSKFRNTLICTGIHFSNNSICNGNRRGNHIAALIFHHQMLFEKRIIPETVYFHYSLSNIKMSEIQSLMPLGFIVQKASQLNLTFNFNLFWKRFAILLFLG